LYFSSLCFCFFYLFVSVNSKNIIVLKNKKNAVFYFKYSFKFLFSRQININLKILKMKKIVLTIATVMAFGFANAQDVKFGAKLGLNFSAINGLQDSDTKSGLALGGFAEIKLNEKFAIQPELMYSMLGAGGKGSNDTVELGYVVIPVMAKYYVVNKFSLEAGPQIGFLASAKYAALETNKTIDTKGFFNSTDFGMNFGGNYDFTNNFSAGLRYTAGLSETFKSEYKDFGLKGTNSNIALTVAYKF
jgi:hypothetical protein